MGDELFTHPVGDSKLLLAVTEFSAVILHHINVENHTTNNWPNHCFAGFPIDQCWVHRRGDAQMKDATRNLASSTKMREELCHQFW